MFERPEKWRRVSERAFAEARDCVIVATSTLELGVDIGDLDRVIQIDAPWSVASFLQRIGRTGRRPGTRRNTLLLAVEPDALLRATGLLLLWGRGYVEPVMPPPSPRHLAAQQLLALALQEGRFGASTWREWWGGLPVMDDGEAVLAHLCAEGFLAEDEDMLLVGPAAEREFGRRHFMDLLSAFTSPLELRVVAGTREIGTVSPLTLALRTPADGEVAKVLLLAGRAWKVESVKWEDREVLVSEVQSKGKVRWPVRPAVETFEMCRAQRDVLLGADPPVALSRRAVDRLARLREEMRRLVEDSGLVIEDLGSGPAASRRLWTWAGVAANATLVGGIGAALDVRLSNAFVDLPPDVTAERIRTADVERALPEVTPDAVTGLEFSAALPPEMAVATLAERFVDRAGAADVVRRRLVVRSVGAQAGPASPAHA